MDPLEPTAAAEPTDAPAASPAPAPAADPAPAAEPQAEPSALDALEDALDSWTGEEDATDAAESPAGDEHAPADKPTAEGEGEKKPEPKPEAKPERSFTVVAADGKEATISWPEGAKVVFKQDGKDRSIESLDKLVDLAQKGDLLDRKAGEFGRDKQVWTREKANLQRQLDDSRAETKAQVDEAERVLRAVLEDPAAAKRVKAALAEHDDPTAKRARETEEENERLKTEKQQEAEQRRTQATERFWAKAQEKIVANVGEGTRFPLLAAEDAEEIVGRYWERYQEHTIGLYEGYVAEGANSEDAEDRAAAEGLKWLTEENLLGVMDELNARFARRFGQPRQDPAQREHESDPAAQDRARAEQHNQRVDRKLEQRQQRTIKGPAAPGRVAVPAVPDGDYENAIEREFDALAERLG